jgi:hypothetical protein
MPGAPGGLGGPGQGYGNGYGYGYGWPGMPPAPNNGMGTASLVIGIISAVVFCLWPLAILLGVLAVVLGILARRKASRGEATNSGQALAGIICGAVGVVLGILITVVFFAGTDDSGDDPFTSTDDGGYSTTLG